MGMGASDLSTYQLPGGAPCALLGEIWGWNRLRCHSMVLEAFPGELWAGSEGLGLIRDTAHLSGARGVAQEAQHGHCPREAGAGSMLGGVPWPRSDTCLGPFLGPQPHSPGGQQRGSLKVPWQGSPSSSYIQLQG